MVRLGVELGVSLIDRNPSVAAMSLLTMSVQPSVVFSENASPELRRLGETGLFQCCFRYMVLEGQGA